MIKAIVTQLNNLSLKLQMRAKYCIFIKLTSNKTDNSRTTKFTGND